MPDTVSGTGSDTVSATIVAAVAFLLLLAAARSWLHQILIIPIDAQRADMLVVIQHGLRRILQGHNPYTTYYVPWDATLPYGPVLWTPYLIPHVLHADIRFASIASSLFIPAMCAVCATALALDRRFGAAAGCLIMLSALAVTPDLRAFIPIAHTPTYWPLLAMYAWFVTRNQWLAAAAFGGLLIVSRTTMIAIAPVLVLAVWLRDRRRAAPVAALLIGFAVVPYLPFAVADPRALVYALYGSYQHLMKGFVWTSTTWAQNTIGVTGLLLRAGAARLVETAQLLAMVLVYLATFYALRGGQKPLPWMAVSLLVFSMTTLWPVHYIYLDVVLLLVCGVLCELRFSRRWHRLAISTPISLATLAIAVAIDVPRMPRLDIGEYSDRSFLYRGFAEEERGDRSFTWVDGTSAELLLPARSRRDAQIDIICQPNLPTRSSVQQMSASLNGVVLGTIPLVEGWQTATFAAPARAWIYGVNQLDLSFSAAVSPAESGTGADTRKLSVAFDRLIVRTAP